MKGGPRRREWTSQGKWGSNKASGDPTMQVGIPQDERVPLTRGSPDSQHASRMLRVELGRRVSLETNRYEEQARRVNYCVNYELVLYRCGRYETLIEQVMKVVQLPLYVPRLDACRHCRKRHPISFLTGALHT